MAARLTKEIATIISGNLAFRLAVALANPKSYEVNRDELASILAEDIAKSLSGRLALSEDKEAGNGRS